MSVFFPDTPGRRGPAGQTGATGATGGTGGTGRPSGLFRGSIEFKSLTAVDVSFQIPIIIISLQLLIKIIHSPSTYPPTNTSDPRVKYLN